MVGHGRGEDLNDRSARRGIDRREFVRRTLAVLGPAALAGCLPGPHEATGVEGYDPAELTAGPGDPSLAAETGATWLELASARDGILYVPDSYDPAVPAPLLVTLHGRGGGAHDWDGFQTACENRGMIMLAVESRSVTWDRVTGAFGPDVTYIDAALAYAFDRCRIDATHIALAGFSDGASYALSLGPSNGDLFTNLIAFSAGFWRPGSVKRGDPGIFLSHGLSDPVLSEYNTRNVILPDLRDHGYAVEYMTFDGGHEVPAEIGTAALDWFLT